VIARRQLLDSRNDLRDQLDARAVEAPARLVTSMRKNRMNAGLRLRLVVEDFNFTALDPCRVKEGDRLQRIVGLGAVHAKFKPHKIA
jgi:hypothetical protein